MAKTNMIARDTKRKRLVDLHAAKRAELKNALHTMLNSKGSYLLEVMVGKELNVFPMVPQGKGVSEVVLSKAEI